MQSARGRPIDPGTRDAFVQRMRGCLATRGGAAGARSGAGGDATSLLAPAQMKVAMPPPPETDGEHVSSGLHHVGVASR